MHIGRFYFERRGFWFKWFWQYAEQEHGYTQHKHGRAALRDPFMMLWMLVWQPVKLLGLPWFTSVPICKEAKLTLTIVFRPSDTKPLQIVGT